MEGSKVIEMVESSGRCSAQQMEQQREPLMARCLAKWKEQQKVSEMEPSLVSKKGRR